MLAVESFKRLLPVKLNILLHILSKYVLLYKSGQHSGKGSNTCNATSVRRAKRYRSGRCLPGADAAVACRTYVYRSWCIVRSKNMKMKINYIRGILPLLLLLAACSPAIRINTEPAAGFQLSNYKTFAFFGVDASGDGLGPVYEPQVQYLQQEITRQLESRGLTRAASQPDLLINLGIVVDEQVQTRETNMITDPPQYIGQRRYTWRSREVEVGRYKEGTVSVHLVDNNRNELVWQGTAEAVLKSKPAKLQAQITKGVAQLMQQVPQ